MYKRRWCVDDQLITEGPGALIAVFLVSTSAGASSVTLYDGVSAAGEVVVTLRAPANEVSAIMVGGCVPFSTGLYIDVGTNVEGVLVIYE